MGKAGVTEQQMKDKDTAMFIVSFVASRLSYRQGSFPTIEASHKHSLSSKLCFLLQKLQ